MTVIVNQQATQSGTSKQNPGRSTRPVIKYEAIFSFFRGGTLCKVLMRNPLYIYIYTYNASLSLCVYYLCLDGRFIRTGDAAATVYASHDTRYFRSYVVPVRAQCIYQPARTQQWQPGLEKITNKLLKTYHIAFVPKRCVFFC